MASFGGGGAKNDSGLSLNLMPMLDIFSIIITFLLMTFSTDPVNYDIEGLELPQSRTFMALDELPTIKVTETAIFVLEEEVAKLVNGQVDPKDERQGAVGPVFDRLDAIRKKRMERQGMLDDPKDQRQGSNKGIVGMEMDKNGKFSVMKAIMLASQQAEFITFKLIVNKPSS